MKRKFDEVNRELLDIDEEEEDQIPSTPLPRKNNVEHFPICNEPEEYYSGCMDKETSILTVEQENIFLIADLDYIEQQHKEALEDNRRLQKIIQDFVHVNELLKEDNIKMSVLINELRTGLQLLKKMDK